MDPPIICHDGACYLKAMIDDTYSSMLSNMASARKNLASLDKFMNALTDSTIIEFNWHVAENLQELTAVKETTTNLLVSLFTGYLQAKYRWIQKFIQGEADIFTNFQMADIGTKLTPDPRHQFLVEMIHIKVDGGTTKSRLVQEGWKCDHGDQRPLMSPFKIT